MNDNYKDYRSDLFAAFVIRASEMTIPYGFCAFLTPYVWMFIQSYEKLRFYLYVHTTIKTLIQFEYSAFEEATVPICTFTYRNHDTSRKGIYVRLADFRGDMEIQRKKTLEAINDPNCVYCYTADQTKFNQIPGSPVAYWLSEAFYNIFSKGELLGQIANSKQGIATADNNTFLRLWQEVNIKSISFSCSNHEEAKNNGFKWFPYNKGGVFRKWYGNNDYIIDWEFDGEKLKKFKRSVIRNPIFFFKPSCTWSDITSSTNAFRYRPGGSLFDVTGMSVFSDDKLNYLLGLCNTKVAAEILKIIAPTLHCQCGDVANIPVIYNKEQEKIITKIVKDNISISKADWDYFENSWDFKCHPLISVISRNKAFFDNATDIDDIAVCYTYWKNECNERFNQLKVNEEELNRIFIDIYGLQDELSPDVEDKDVTVRKADLQRDIKSLISYAVGCMFGRYSLNKEGLAYAGGEWDESIYSAFVPDRDNIIPICDEEYFSDDIVSRFCEWVKIVYGEKSLETNLDFIAKALGNKGNTSREVIRNYFLNDFFKDHCNTYSVTGSGKRPIYWMFDSGKQNGFKALIYMHRYDADTVGRVRTDYLHKAQKYVETAMQSAQYTIDNATSASEKSKATKAVTKYTKQLAEMRIYDEAIAHVANQRIEIDLDDGVKVNYAKFQGVEVTQEGKKTLKIDLLAKI